MRVVLALSMLLAAAPAAADVKNATGEGFTVVHSRHIEATPAKVFAALPAVERWWDPEHTYSGDALNLSLRAEAGSCFCERWKNGSVEHGRVILSMQDQMLRLEGALGPLQPRAVTGILTFQLKPESNATIMTLTYVVNGTPGSALDKTAPAVDEVLGQQLARLTRFVETGKATP